jgi:predicted transcriptional regulator
MHLLRTRTEHWFNALEELFKILMPTELEILRIIVGWWSVGSFVF